MAEIQAQFPGIFYRKPAPDKPNFVEEGDSVTAGQTVGIIEVMKTFSEIKAGSDGIIQAFGVENEGMVSPGQTIATVEEG